MELHWPLILFTFFVCMASGILFVQGLLTALGKGEKTQNVAIIAAFVAMCIGGISVFMHLQHWERIFNGFGHITSGITLEFIGAIVFVIALAVFFLMGRRAEDGVAPKWCGIVGMVVGVAMTAVTGDSYLMPALPVWDTPLLIIFYLCNMLAMGGVSLLIIGAALKTSDGEGLAVKVALVGLVASVVALIAYAAIITTGGAAYAELGYYFDPTLPDKHMVDVAAVINVLSGERALLFWLGAIAVGVVVPFVLVLLAGKKEGTAKLGMYIAAMVCLMAGGIVWRCITYLVALHAFATF